MNSTTRTTLMVILTIILLIAFCFNVVINGGIVFDATGKTENVKVMNEETGEIEEKTQLTGFSKFLDPFTDKSKKYSRQNYVSYFGFNIVILAAIVASIVLGATTPEEKQNMEKLFIESNQGDPLAQAKIMELAGIKL